MLTPNQMFKAGFLLRCADEGLTEAETTERIQEAQQFVEKRSFPTPTAVGLGKFLTSLGLWGLVGGGVAGGVAGYGAGSMTADPIEPDEVKKQELIAAYQQHSDRARRQLALGQYRNPTPRKPSLGMV